MWPVPQKRPLALPGTGTAPQDRVTGRGIIQRLESIITIVKPGTFKIIKKAGITAENCSYPDFLIFVPRFPLSSLISSPPLNWLVREPGFLRLRSSPWPCFYVR